MSTAINRAIIFKDRTTPTEVPTAGEVYFWLEGDSLKYKTSSGLVNTLSSGITAEQVEDIIGTFVVGSSTISWNYDDANNQLIGSVIQAGIDHTQISNRGTNTHAQIDSHLSSVANPHSTTKAQVGLANVPNIDATNPANITQSATFRFVTDTEKTTWNSKENAIASGTTSQYFRGDKTFQTLDKAAVGLGNVDNTSDALKPISNATQTALNGKENTITAGTTAQYFRGDKTFQTLDKAAVGLGNVDNTSDAAKPISTANQTALNGKENSITPGSATQYWRGDKTFQTLDKTAVGLGNVDNTSDLLKPISTATQLALNAKYDASNPNNYETPVQLNARDTANRTRANHTGTQLAGTISDFAATVRSTVLTGLSLATNAAIDATDSVLSAFGKIQAQLNGHFGQGGSVHANATTSAAGFMSATDKTKLDGITNDVFLVNTTTYSNTSNVTYVTCPELAVPVVAGRVYRIKWSIRHTSAATTTGFRPGLGGTATGTVNFVGSVVQSVTASTTNIIAGPLSAFNTNIPSTSSAGTQATVAEIEGIFICTTSGLIYPQFLSETNGSQVQVLNNSLCIYKEIA